MGYSGRNLAVDLWRVGWGSDLTHHGLIGRAVRLRAGRARVSFRGTQPAEWAALEGQGERRPRAAEG
jgi:hypothetical protein